MGPPSCDWMAHAHSSLDPCDRYVLSACKHIASQEKMHVTFDLFGELNASQVSTSHRIAGSSAHSTGQAADIWRGLTLHCACPHVVLPA